MIAQGGHDIDPKDGYIQTAFIQKTITWGLGTPLLDGHNLRLGQ